AATAAPSARSGPDRRARSAPTPRWTPPTAGRAGRRPVAAGRHLPAPGPEASSGGPDSLFDGAEDRVALLVAHLDAHRVAGLQERRLRLALEEGLHRPHLGDAGIADAALAQRLARAAVRPTIGDRARAHDRAGAQRSGLGRMGDQGPEVEGHVDAGVRLAERLAVELDGERAAELAVLPVG